jgi:hypothetical protein
VILEPEGLTTDKDSETGLNERDVVFNGLASVQAITTAAKNRRRKLRLFGLGFFSGFRIVAKVDQMSMFGEVAA